MQNIQQRLAGAQRSVSPKSMKELWLPPNPTPGQTDCCPVLTGHEKDLMVSVRTDSLGGDVTPFLP